MNNLTNMFWDEHFRGKERSGLPKIKQKIYDWLNGDNFGGFVLDGKVFWIEKTCNIATLPNYVYDYLKRWARRKGYIALFTATEEVRGDKKEGKR
jgi:hypothetical protein